MRRMKTAKSINKPPPIQAAAKKTNFDGDNDIQFEVELCWCVQQLQTALQSGNLSQKVAEDTSKNLKTLTSQTAPLIKKRQVMKSALGDYRSKMQQEEKKMLLASKQIKFTTANENKPKSSFVKKSALLTSGKDFRFNFALPNNNDENEAAATQDVPQTAAAATRISSSLQLSSGKEEPFRFNFQIENGPEDINFDGLMLNS
ncbi:UPF0488 protein CG14286 [Drosophila mojavensis]|uniref:Uncharacterized protein n=1 Tax=Drosophila mojavensis TaxID=7230 RepID=B4L7N1_DROMO|nr:UPF0488 protein CG14286 [Drosophila mojavensis]EDW05744.1 uncharacterized protein Dmoj_GI11205 [Drosophila mojavensis]